MFQENDKVLINSTNDLPTSFNGKIGWIRRSTFANTHPGFWIVIVICGTETVFHESQLTKVEDK